jgi:hypothetical protein
MVSEPAPVAPAEVPEFRLYSLNQITLAAFLGSAFPGLLVSLPFIVITRLMANHWLGPDLAAHTAAGGAQGSWWVTILIGVVGLLVVFAFILVPVVVLDIVSPLDAPAT